MSTRNFFVGLIVFVGYVTALAIWVVPLFPKMLSGNSSPWNIFLAAGVLVFTFFAAILAKTIMET